jgi:hypothetical protein
MRKRVILHLRRHAVAYLALFVALGGTAVALPLGKRFVKGHGKLVSRSFSAQEIGFLPDPKPVLARIPGFGKVEFLACFNREIRVRLLSFDKAKNFSYSSEVRAGGIPPGTGQEHNVDIGGGSLGHGGGEPLIGKVNTPNGFTLGMAGKWDFQVWRGDGSHTTGAHVVVSGTNGDFDNSCRVNAQTILQK